MIPKSSDLEAAIASRIDVVETREFADRVHATWRATYDLRATERDLRWAREDAVRADRAAAIAERAAHAHRETFAWPTRVRAYLIVARHGVL